MTDEIENVDNDTMVSDKLKKVQMEWLEKLGSGSMNQNELVAMMQLMQKEEPENMKDTMQMVYLMQMMNPKPDPMSQIFPMILMDNMKGDGDSDLKREIEALKTEILKKDEDRKYQQVLEEVRKMQNQKDNIGLKDIVTIMTSKDEMIERARSATDAKDKELLVTQLQSSFGALKDEIKNLGGGGDIGKVGKTITQIREIADVLNINKPVEKSSHELMKDLVDTTVKTFGPSVSKYVETMSQSPQTGSHQFAKLQEIQSQRQNDGTLPATSAPAIPATPAPVVSDEKPSQVAQTDQFGSVVTPDLIDISSGPDKAIRKPIK